MSTALLISLIISAIIGFALLIWGYLRYQNGKSNQIGQALYEDEDYFNDDDPLFKETASTHQEKSVDQAITQEEDVATETKSDQKDDKELLIALFLLAPKGKVFSGNDIFAVLENAGMNYGDMQIFHHYGVGELKVKKAIFSVADLAEPGIFNPQDRETFTTQGLTFVMRLPGPFGGRVAFELMLNHAQRTAEELQGILVNARRQPVNQEVIGEIRNHIAQFEEEL